MDKSLYPIRHDYTLKGGPFLETTLTRNFQRKTVKNFLDMIILAKLRHGPMSGYDIMNLIYSEFHFLISSGTVYSLLYSLERSGLIIGIWGRRKRLYRLTEKGEETIKALADANYKVQCLMSSVLKLIAGVDDSEPAELRTTL